MQISKDKVVTMDYTLTDQEGTVIDSSDGRAPLAYIQGAGQMIPGLERALEGHSEGENVNVSLPPDQGYGQRDETLLQVVPRRLFEAVDDLRPGMQFEAQTESGTQVVTVVNVEDEEVAIDANHPLAGVTLNFDVTVVGVRHATAEELDHGHVHGHGGHEHE
ncbi:MAG: peptidylprolyl isomerase [Gammaproteobacteria bacterium]|nr:peptidylprolyl isomerase [Gammaproteobacteria bacterium]NIT63403.1 peptidylprolyl isomerase [Gammaproteobacteria bacterium]NIX10210.1 peptidylprolyl isomerase [Gammaproteobacteria bacterium]NIY31983.1 peptidylprolyl isomerase [Gammaproteobacteria bacterium]